MKKMKLNPDLVVVEAIRRRLIMTGGYCPCKPEEIGNEDYKCCCKKYREERECCCELFVEA